MAGSWNAPSWKSIKRGSVFLLQEADGHYYKVVLSSNNDSEYILSHLQAGNPRRISIKKQFSVALSGPLVQTMKESDAQCLDRLLARTKKPSSVDVPSQISAWHVARQWYRHQKDDEKYFLRQLTKLKSSDFTAFEPVLTTAQRAAAENEGEPEMVAFLIRENGTRFYNVGVSGDCGKTLAFLQAGNHRNLTLEKTVRLTETAGADDLENQLRKFCVAGKNGGKNWYHVKDGNDEEDFMAIFGSCTPA